MNEPKEGDEKMEKLGVQEDVDQESLEKKASDDCPVCGKTPVRQGHILLCPVHGSEPWEGQKSA